MKAATSKQPRSKNSARENSKKKSTTIVNTFIKKVNKNVPVNLPSKSILLNSHRVKPRTESIKIASYSQQMTANHSRKNSVHIGKMPVSGRSNCPNQESKEAREEPRRSRQHNRSNSTISKQSGKEVKNCFKIDISKLVGKEEVENKIRIQPKEVNKMHFDYLYVIGKGGFGKVWAVEFKKTHKIYAMKEMLKSKIIGKKSIHSVMNQRELLCKLKHPFIVNMSYAFQDRESLYLVMDLLVGGDLRYHMGCRRKFKESEAKFFIACIMVGLQMLHFHNIIHRDIKPQNLVFDERGYLRITDLGIARIVKPDNSADTSGTPGYMAPQVMCRQDHSFSVDYYAVGVIAYELMLGRRPYNGRNRKQIRDHILSKQVQVKPEQLPHDWSAQAQDFVNKMIQRKPQNRLGSDNGTIEIKDHPWLKNFPWAQLLKKKIPSPFQPHNIVENADYRDQISSSSEDENEQENKLLLRRKSVEELFQGYSYFSKEKKELRTKEREREKKTGSNIPTTANTHYSYLDDKESGKIKAKLKNYLKG